MPLTPYRTLVFLSVFTLLFCSSAARAQQGSIREAIEEGNKQWSATLSRGDSAGMAVLYTPNAQLFPTYSDIVSGTEAIQKFWQGVITSGGQRSDADHA
jgi:ketosteroid isomerase-like protein